MRRKGIAIAWLGAAAFASTPVAAGDGAESLATVAGTVYGARDEATLFGPSGQIYQPADGEDTWRRRALGGVAAEVTGVVRARSGALFAAGSRMPLFRREQGVWFTHALPNRGRATLAAGGAIPALGVERHIYVLRGEGWRRSRRAPGEIAALWASREDRIYLATDDGKLYRSSGRRFREIAHRLEDDDRITGLIGRPDESLYAIAESGAVLQVGSRRARVANIPAALAPRRIDAIGYLADGTPALAVAIAPAGGETAGDGETDEPPADEPHADEAPEAALVALRGDVASVEATLPPLAAGDRIAAIGARDGHTVVATERGLVAIREGDSWRTGKVLAAPPDDARRRFEGAAPARSP